MHTRTYTTLIRNGSSIPDLNAPEDVSRLWSWVVHCAHAIKRQDSWVHMHTTHTHTPTHKHAHTANLKLMLAQYQMIWMLLSMSVGWTHTSSTAQPIKDKRQLGGYFSSSCFESMAIWRVGTLPYIIITKTEST